MNAEVANRLQQLRKAKGLSQEELANILGLSRQAISKWERAETSPDTDNLICLAKLYNISIDSLLSTDESIEEIKERIAQERISEIDKDKEEKFENDEISEQDFEKSIFEDYTDEEKDLKVKADDKSGNFMFAMLGVSILCYIIIGTKTNDWSWGWLLIVQTMFGVGVVNGLLYEDRHFSVISFFFCIALTMISVREALWAEDSLAFVLTIISVSIAEISSIITFVIFIIFSIKGKKDLDTLYYKKKYIEQRDKFLEVKGRFDEFKKDLDKINK